MINLFKRMPSTALLIASSLLLFFTVTVSATLPESILHYGPKSSCNFGGTRLAARSPSDGQVANYTYWFDQLIDHTNPSLGTFKQRYFFNDQYYKGQGSPIVLMTPGESDAGGFWTSLTGDSTVRALMYQLGGAGVVIEHRYWGKSSPYNILSTDNLRYLTLDQSLADLKYFVENVKLPFGPTIQVASTTPDTTPWVHIGCSYPGLLAAYFQQKYPAFFAASWASSAPVQADSDFWEYYAPIEEGMPKNCSTDAGLVVSYIDSIFDTGDVTQITAMKAKFGMEAVENDDFGQSIASVFSGWQSMDANTYNDEGEHVFYKFCDALETLPTGQISMTEAGVGLQVAFENYANYWRINHVEKFNCPGGSCYTTYDYSSAMYTDWSVDNQDGMRQWLWMVCNEFGWFQTGDPANLSIIVSKYVTEAYNLRKCSHYFPLADGTLKSYAPDVTGNNAENKGWNLMAPHLFVTNGQYDPWRSASISSDFGPGSTTSSEYQRVVVVPGGHHCWDFSTYGAQFSDGAKEVISIGLQQMSAWVQLWYQQHPAVPHIVTALPAIDNTFGINDGGSSSSNTTTTTDSVDKLKEELAKAQSQLNNTLGSKALVYASLGLNAGLIVALIAALIFLFKRSRSLKGAKYRGSHTDKLGEYGAPLMTGSGSRGSYQAVVDKH